ncbi:glutathione S-transferase family protein [Oceanicoccus sp. KOV_DT_Chl]|uniref:glutathione S-transferase family protein n=1 Tax=Oceanicoccus sp. KOV_DT_Chl TaxID=1904639 RepID=UPI000C7A7F66|nr:glutathione S-transferase family protein [Oceanicoccus sp. KOV_DT_Chl]
MKLYSVPHSPYASRVRIQIYAKNIPVDIIAPEGFRTPEYKKVNPTGKVPALDIGDMVLPESAVIMDYLEERYPEVPLIPADAKQRMLVNLFSRVPDTYVSTALFPLFSQVFQKTDSDETIAANVANMKAQLKLLDQLFADYGRVDHDTLDLADCHLAPIMYFVFEVCGWFGEKDPLAGCDNLQAWWQWANNNEHISRVLEEMDTGFKAFLARLKG